MYINKIDDLIDKVIDEFYLSNNEKNDGVDGKLLGKIYAEANFIKYQKEINLLMSKFIDKLNLQEIKELVKNSDAIYSVVETIKRYVAFYMFLTIGFNYPSKEDTFVNNIVEFSKNQPEYEYKINNYFNSESNAILIKYNTMIKNILVLIDADKTKLNILKNKPDYREAILFLNDLGSEFIDNNFRLENLKKNKSLQAHNIIKTIIILLLYKVNEKKEFFRLLEMTENLDGEYMFIDIVVPRQQYIDFNSVEKLLGSSPDVKNLAYQFWDFISQHEEFVQLPPTTVDEKLSFLLQSGIVYPICDDFLLYHKGSERYDRVSDPTKVKKKEDTKIRYIVNKIDTVSEYYSDQSKKNDQLKQSIKKNFYVPMFNRKAILVNTIEDNNIVNKFLNQGKHSIENAEYFNDLVSYKLYPYVNFKDFDKYGFSITVPKTIDVVRYVSISGEHKSKELQFRVGGKDNVINIVGLMVPSNTKPFHCIKPSEMIDIRSLTKNRNGYESMLRYIKESHIGTKKHRSSVYWIFDAEKDIANTATNMSEKDSVEQIKNIVSLLYDGIVSELYYLVADKFENKKDLTLQAAYNVLKKFAIKLPYDVHNDIEGKIYESIGQFVPEYDKSDDNIFGIDDNAIKLPTLPTNPNKNIQRVKINLEKTKDAEIIGSEDEDLQTLSESICQHYVSWDKITSIQRTNPKLYIDNLYDYVQQYVAENAEQEYVCKSCGHQLNIKKYITDGEFDDTTQKFVTYSMPMDIALEDILEYEKYKTAIRNIDKLIEKIAMISGISHLTKSTANTKGKRKAVVKDVIDLVLMNNKKLKINMKERNENSAKNYGINKDLSNMFVFELENAIFVYSSKDKDHYKPIKQNNILAYIVFLVLLEMNDTQIIMLNSDKKGMCNFLIFDKIMMSLFGGLKIKINKRGDLDDITNYKILCYAIYMIGCFMIKYNMWYFEYPDPTKKIKYAPTIQKIFVHTIVDIMNSVLDFGNNDNAHYLYGIIALKMYKKIGSLFANTELYTRLKNENKVSVSSEKKEQILSQRKLVELSGKYVSMPFIAPKRIICKVPKFYVKTDVAKNTRKKLSKINNVTNCETGEFHNWKHVKGELLCSKCNMSAEKISYVENESNKIASKFKYVRLQNLAKKFCSVDGLPHQFVLDESNLSICTKCNNKENYSYSHEQLNSLEKIMEKAKKHQTDAIFHISDLNNTKLEKEYSHINDTLNDLTKQYTSQIKNNNQYIFLEKFVETLQSNMEHVKHIEFVHDSYVINHNHLGYDLPNSITVTEKDNKIFYKQNHTFFKTDVIYYTTFKNGKIDIFYDAMTKILLGYKEDSKNYVLSKKDDKKIVINYSVLNKLKMMGFETKFISLNNSEESPTMIINNVVSERLTNLKKIIAEFQRTLYRILNGYTMVKHTDDTKHHHNKYEKNDKSHDNHKDHDNHNFHSESEYFANKLNVLVEKHARKLKNIKHTVFKDWNIVTRGIYPSETIDIDSIISTDTVVVNVDDINKIDINGNVMLYYIVTELSKFVETTRKSSGEFMVDFINTVFDLFNKEKIFDNLDVKRFEYIMASTTYIQEIADRFGMRETEGIYNEIHDPDQEITQEDIEEATDLKEENDAMDMEEEYPYEQEFDRAQGRQDGDIIYVNYNDYVDSFDN